MLIKEPSGICLWRAVQGHSIVSIDGSPEERGFQPIELEPDVLPVAYHNTCAHNLSGKTGITTIDIVPGGVRGHWCGATRSGKKLVFASPIDPEARFVNPLNLKPYNYHHGTTIRINHARAKAKYGIQFYIPASGAIMIFQTISADCLDFAFNVETYDKIWSSDTCNKEEARKAAAVQKARLESINDGTIPRSDDDGTVGGATLLRLTEPLKIQEFSFTHHISRRRTKR